MGRLSKRDEGAEGAGGPLSRFDAARRGLMARGRGIGATLEPIKPRTTSKPVTNLVGAKRAMDWAFKPASFKPSGVVSARA